ncbi:U-box domain-containing protein [Nemania sp. FL0031]|nr:U-box domain-containing protein [Nemania sp. FL0031]
MHTQDLPSYSAAAESMGECPPYAEYDDSDTELTKSTATLDSDSDDPVVTIHPLMSKDGVLVKVQPPVKPRDHTIDHIPCDIVLVIDVSWSMNDPAPAPINSNRRDKENFGMTVLDLTKHAARTIVSTLNEGDRLGIVTFSKKAKVVHELTPVTTAQKEKANTAIKSMEPRDNTNLWGGITKGLSLFKTRDAGGRVPALMVLTDGQPNWGIPAQGYLNALRSMSPLPAVINMFGFGYEIESGLLKAIAEATDGNYAFIPDAGMIGTVFVHAVAHLHSTYATRCTLKLTAPKGMLLKSTTGKSISRLQYEEGRDTISIQLGNLQYGQSRDIYLENVDKSGRRSTFELSEKHRFMHAKLTYSRMQYPQYITFADHDMMETSTLSQSIIAYHQSRSMLCELLSSLFHADPDEYRAKSSCGIEIFQGRLLEVIHRIPAREYKDRYNRSIIEDLEGQITEALSDRRYLDRWGYHYFLSLWNTHEKQLCNSFKDAGPLMYNDNEFFIRCRDALNTTFDTIPGPTEDRGVYIPIKETYNNSNNGCFSAASPVRLATGCEVPVGTLQQGMEVQTAMGPRRVRAVLKTEVRGISMCRVGDLVVTPWHPVKLLESGHNAWVFPIDVAEQTIEYSGTICSVLLEPSPDVDAHAIWVGGAWGVALGHGLLSGGDVRAHRFFGNYNAVLEELRALGPGDHGVYYSAGLRRDADTGKVCGFKPLPSGYVSDVVGRDIDLVELKGRLLEVCV